jgi:hypothetical protein
MYAFLFPLFVHRLFDEWGEDGSSVDTELTLHIDHVL